VIFNRRAKDAGLGDSIRNARGRAWVLRAVYAAKVESSSDKNGRLIMMEDVPAELQNHILGAFYIRKGKLKHAMGLELHSGHGEAIFVVTRKQLLDIADECRKAADTMPKPS
jgi:hypothetical protein